MHFSFPSLRAAGTLALAAPALFCAVRAAPQSPAPRPAPSAPAFAPNYLEMVPLRFADPRTVTKAINGSRLPDGVMKVSPDPRDRHALRVVGTQDGIAAVRALVALVDVAPRQATLAVRVVRVALGADGKRAETLVGRASATATHNVPLTFTFPVRATGDTAVVVATLRFAGTDKTAPPSVALITRFGVRLARGAALGLESDTALQPGAPARRVVGLIDSDNAALVSTVARGETPTVWRGALAAYYLEAKVGSVTVAKNVR